VVVLAHCVCQVCGRGFFLILRCDEIQYIVFIFQPWSIGSEWSCFIGLEILYLLAKCSDGAHDVKIEKKRKWMNLSIRSFNESIRVVVIKKQRRSPSFLSIVIRILHHHQFCSQVASWSKFYFPILS